MYLIFKKFKDVFYDTYNNFQNLIDFHLKQEMMFSLILMSGLMGALMLFIPDAKALGPCSNLSCIQSNQNYLVVVQQPSPFSNISRTIPLYEITTRGDFDLNTGLQLKPDKLRGVQGLGYEGHYSLSDLNELVSSCPSEIAIFVHGWNLTDDNAKERFDRLKLSLEHDNYYIHLVGFSWDSDTAWYTARFIAKGNGDKLAQFISDYMASCKHQNKDTKIRLIGHSLGARVILSSLFSLDNNQTWNNNNFKITSVHLMGAAVDDEEVYKNLSDIPDEPLGWQGLKYAYGRAIEDEVTKFNNLFSPEDDALEPRPPPVFYPYFEGDFALGQHGFQLGILLPTNYNQTNVQNQIPADCDSNGDSICDLSTITVRGDNHFGYIGFRDAVTKGFKDDGAVDVVVNDWKE